MTASSPLSNNPSWRLTTRQECQLRCWDDACVSYAWPSGNTVLITPAQGLVLQHLAQGACREAELAGFLEEAFDLPLGTAGDIISDMLAELQVLRLIENAPQ